MTQPHTTSPAPDPFADWEPARNRLAPGQPLLNPVCPLCGFIIGQAPEVEVKHPQLKDFHFHESCFNDWFRTNGEKRTEFDLCEIVAHEQDIQNKVALDGK